MKLIKIITLLILLLLPVMSVANEMPQMTDNVSIKGSLRVPTRTTIDIDGNFYILDGRSNTVKKYNKFNEDTGFRPLIAGISGTGLAVSGDNLYISTGDTVAIVNSDTGRFVGNMLDVEYSVGDIAVDDYGLVYVQNRTDRTIVVYTPEHTVYKVIGMKPSWVITSIYIDGDMLYMTDSLHTTNKKPSVHVMNILTGKMVKNIKNTGINFFDGMSSDKYGRTYYVMSETNSIRVFDENDNLLGDFGGTFSRPTDVDYDPLTHRLFVTTNYNVQVHGIDGAAVPVKPEPVFSMPTQTLTFVETEPPVVDITPEEPVFDGVGYVGMNVVFEIIGYYPDKYLSKEPLISPLFPHFYKVHYQYP